VTVELEFRPDDLTGEPTRALIAHHLVGMHATSPAESVHALDLDGLRDPAVTFLSGWRGDDLVVIGALKQLDEANGELKSMRVADEFLGTGSGRAMLRALVDLARGRGIQSLWLETGSTDDFVPARRLYASEGFVECGPFPPYIEDPFSTFMTRAV
jgi:putative acetyltransferase